HRRTTREVPVRPQRRSVRRIGNEGTALRVDGCIDPTEHGQRRLPGPHPRTNRRPGDPHVAEGDLQGTRRSRRARGVQRIVILDTHLRGSPGPHRVRRAEPIHGARAPADARLRERPPRARWMGGAPQGACAVPTATLSNALKHPLRGQSGLTMAPRSTYVDGMTEATKIASQASSSDPRVGLLAVAALRRLVEQLETLQVTNARDLGWSWQEIAQELNVSKQAAHKKHAGRRFLPGR